MVDNTPERFTSVVIQDNKLISIIREIVQKYNGPEQAVHDRALAVYAHMAFRFKDDPDGRINITDVYNSEMRPLDAPLDGHPFPEDMLVNGLSSGGSRSSRRGPQNPVEQQAALLSRYAPRQQGITDEDIAHEVSVAQSNAQIFSEALSSTPLDQLESSEIIQEFLGSVKASQEKILGLIASVPDSPGFPPPNPQVQQPLAAQPLMEEPQSTPVGLAQPLQPVQAPPVTRNGKGRATSKDPITPTELHKFEPLESPKFPMDNNPFRDPALLQQFEQEASKPVSATAPPAPISTEPASSNPILSTLLSTNEQLHSVIEQYNHALERRDSENAVKSVAALQNKGKSANAEDIEIDDYGMRVGSSRSASASHAVV